MIPLETVSKSVPFCVLIPKLMAVTEVSILMRSRTKLVGNSPLCIRNTSSIPVDTFGFYPGYLIPPVRSARTSEIEKGSSRLEFVRPKLTRCRSAVPFGKTKIPSQEWGEVLKAWRGKKTRSRADFSFSFHASSEDNERRSCVRRRQWFLRLLVLCRSVPLG